MESIISNNRSKPYHHQSIVIVSWNEELGLVIILVLDLLLLDDVFTLWQRFRLTILDHFHQVFQHI